MAVFYFRDAYGVVRPSDTSETFYVRDCYGVAFPSTALPIYIRDAYGNIVLSNASPLYVRDTNGVVVDAATVAPTIIDAYGNRVSTSTGTVVWAGGVFPGNSLTPAAIAATGLYFRWNPTFSALTTTTDAQSRTVVTQMNDMVGSAHAISSGTEHPVLMTDLQGRRFLRFNSNSWMSFTTAAAMNYKSVMLHFVGRMHRPASFNSGITNIVYLNGYNGGTPHAHLNVAPNQTTPFLRIVNTATSTATNRNRAVAGSQLQLLTIRSRTTAPNIQIRVNQDTIVAPAGTITSAVQASAGGQIGALNSGGNFGGFDLYEISGYNVEVDSGGGTTTLDANCAAYTSYYNIGAFTRSIALEGDSRTYGYSGPLQTDYGNNAQCPSGDCLAVQLAMNSSDNDVRIVSVAATGNVTADIATQRDLGNSMMNSTGGFVSGWQNDVHYLIGTNDQKETIGTGGPPVWATTEYTTARGDEVMDRVPGVISYAYTATVGCLQRGLRCYVSTEISRNDSGTMGALDELRTRVLDPAFLVSCFADAGNTYTGKVIVNDLGGWTVSGSTIFRTAANANNTTYYNTDKLHLKAEGTRQYALSIRAALGLTAA